MQVSRSDKSPTETKITVQAGNAELEPIKNHVLGHFKGKVAIPGFREGHAPGDLLEKYVDPSRLMDEFMEHALNDLYRRAVLEQKLRPVGQPKVTIKKFVPYTDLEFDAEMEVIGPVKLPDYKKMKLAKPKVEVTAKDVNDVLTSLRQRAAERKDADRPAKNGDELIIDFAGTDAKGEPVSGADGKDYPLVLGSNTFIPGFEDKLVGSRAGETKEFAITFPKDYGVAALQSKKVTFKVEVKKVSELIEPKLDDALAKKIGPFKNLAELKADIKKQVLAERRQAAEQQYQNQLVNKIAEKSTVEIPASLIDQQVMAAEEEEKRNLAYRGQTWQEHLKEEGLTEEQHRQRQRPNAEQQVKGGIVLSEIAEREKLDVTPQELEIRLQILKGQYQDPAMQAELDKPANQQDIANRLLTEKTLAKLTEYASK